MKYDDVFEKIAKSYHVNNIHAGYSCCVYSVLVILENSEHFLSAISRSFTLFLILQLSLHLQIFHLLLLTLLAL